MGYRKEYLSGKPAMNNFKSFLTLEPQFFTQEKLETLTLQDFTTLNTAGEPNHLPVDLTWEAGVLQVILGSNGTGKTTLLESILGLTDRYQGRLPINGLANQTCSDMVYVPAEPYVSTHGQLSQYEQASLGQKKMATLKFALATDKAAYLLDEPTNYLDEQHKQHLVTLLAELMAKNKRVLIVTHDVALFSQLEMRTCELVP